MTDPRAYAAEQLAIILGAPVALTDAQADRCWAMLTREEERRAPTDRHGNYPHTRSVLARLDLLEQPPLHDDIAALGGGMIPPRWPNGHRFAACLTHDVDRIVRCPWRERLRQYRTLSDRATRQQAFRWHAAAIAYGLRALVGCSDTAPYDFYLEEEGKRGFHSTFFVLPERLQHPTVYDHFYRYSDHVRLLGARMTFAKASQQAHALGWEIGLHGSYASAYDARILSAEKADLEAMLGQPVTAVRQHFLRFNAEITPRVQADVGFTVDATLGYSRTIGCRAGLAFPYCWPEQDLLEIPLIIQDVGLLRNSEHRGDLCQAIARVKALITRIAQIGGMVTLSWHTHPDSPGAHACYRALLDLISNLGGWGCTAGELNAWWRQRRAALRLSIMRMAL